MKQQHDFKKSLAHENEVAVMPFWEEGYREFFGKAHGKIDSIIRCENKKWQKLGVDRIIVLDRSGDVGQPCKRHIYVEEKYRKKDYFYVGADGKKSIPEIFLETWSDKDRKIPGWMAKPMLCDWLAYAFLPSRKLFLFPYAPLKAAFDGNRDEWKIRYSEKQAENNGYFTTGIPVPGHELWNKITELYYKF